MCGVARPRQNARRRRGRVADGAPGRIRLATIQDFSAASLHGFVAANLLSATIKTDDGSLSSAPNVAHDPHVVGNIAAHIVLLHRVFSNLDFARVYHPAKTSPKLSRRIRLPFTPPLYAPFLLLSIPYTNPYLHYHHNLPLIAATVSSCFA